MTGGAGKLAARLADPETLFDSTSKHALRFAVRPTLAHIRASLSAFPRSVPTERCRHPIPGARPRATARPRLWR